MPAMDDCDYMYLVGDFNDWNETDHPMQPSGVGAWSLTLDLGSGREYQYRFRTSDGAWLNDPAAPRAPNPFGSENSVVSTSAVATSAD
jgi:1,4-alpha-glucan branching enzyme